MHGRLSDNKVISWFNIELNIIMGVYKSSIIVHKFHSHAHVYVNTHNLEYVM